MQITRIVTDDICRDTLMGGNMEMTTDGSTKQKSKARIDNNKI